MPSAETTVSLRLEGKKWNTNKPPLWPSCSVSPWQACNWTITALPARVWFLLGVLQCQCDEKDNIKLAVSVKRPISNSNWHFKTWPFDCMKLTPSVINHCNTGVMTNNCSYCVCTVNRPGCYNIWAQGGYLLLAVRSHWKPEGWCEKRTRGHRALRIFCTPTHPGPNWSTHSPMTDRMLWVTARSEVALFSWYSRDRSDCGCTQRVVSRLILNHSLFAT